MKVVVGLSGGVDSSVAALLLKQSGYDVVAVFMKNWSDNECTSEDDYQEAAKVAARIGIKLKVVDFSKEYYSKVFQVALDDLKIGLTPNPDILCNQEIKFACFLDYALSLDAQYVATGHYGKIVKKSDDYLLTIPHDKSKDQTYFLYTLKQKQLKKVIFPLCDLNKEQVRKIAQDNRLSNFNRKDSTGICFIGPKNYKNFIKQYIPPTPGDIVTEENDIIGTHEGTSYYTIGQRKGLSIGGLKNYPEAPWYIIDKNDEQLIVSQNKQHPKLWLNELNYTNLSLTSSMRPSKISAKVRYQQKSMPATIDYENNKITFDKPVFAITKGQAVVFYENDVCIGGAKII